MRRKINREREVWAALSHPNILPFYGFAEDAVFEPYGALISPWCQYGDALYFFTQYGSVLTIPQRITLWKGAIAGASYLHSHKPTLVHGNITPSNTLIDQYGRAVLCDFGLVRIFLDEGSSGMTTMTAHTGTERYLAPELVTGEEMEYPTTASDVYALGCIGLEFVFDRKVYAHRKHNLRGCLIDDIASGMPPAEEPSNITPGTAGLWKIIETCWNPDPTLRPTSQILFDGVDQIRLPEEDASGTRTPKPKQVDLSNEEDKLELDALPTPEVPEDLTGLVTVDVSARPKFRGSYSFVYQGTYQGELVAVKIILEVGKPESMTKKVKRETSIWASASHPNIHPFYGVANDDCFSPYGALISPWYNNGDLQKFLSQREDMPLEGRLQLWKGTIEGVVYLHSRNPKIVHGDLKPGNVLIDQHETPRICDFGLARIFFDEEMSLMTTTQHTGTVRYLAPELLPEDEENILPTTASDVYALGCLGLEILFGQIPFSNRKNNYAGRIFRDIKDGVPPSAKAPDSPSSMRVWPLLMALWKTDPTERPPAKTILTMLEAMSSM
ncbi:hypothetical protein M408DRAFT_333661 [Serendipita vermifera MAFF 305830]|uniref:Protein kinase domain-containing protein n=1 Tax=Serendipita vermifera MAFF 305830 TaxID=933852 RepID=A0A0C2WUJ6_SERVB|nr:hypothetical protein M408DRAFT_333661 [Serendipita vermifera MAFF 305830]